MTSFNSETYINNAACNNSLLSSINISLLGSKPINEIPTVKAALLYGSYLDTMITQPDKVDYANRCFYDIETDCEIWEKAYTHAKALSKDPLIKSLYHTAEGQYEDYGTISFFYLGYTVTVESKALYDFYRKPLIIDIKTTSKSGKSEITMKSLNYDRQAAWYLDTAGNKADRIMFCFLPKDKQNIVESVSVSRHSTTYVNGRAKYRELCFLYWVFSGIDGSESALNHFFKIQQGGSNDWGVLFYKAEKYFNHLQSELTA